jgi:hypothetical protein
VSKPRQRQCENCREPLGDSDYVTVTGRKTNRVWFVHKPSHPHRGMCFRFFTASAEQVAIGPGTVMVFDPEKDAVVWNVQLAREIGLDERACEAVGLDWQMVRDARRESNRRGRKLRSPRAATD